MRRLLAVLMLAACSEDGVPEWRHTLTAEPNPFGPDNPLWAPQPFRDKPTKLVATQRALYVTLPGREDAPGHELAVLDPATGALRKRIGVGSGPTGMALHPDGHFLLVTNRWSNFVSIVDTRIDQVIEELPAPFYTIQAVFSRDGRRLYLTNRWHDSVMVWDVEATGGGLRVHPAAEIPVGTNPRDLWLSPDGVWLYVANLTGLSVSVIDTTRNAEVARPFLNSPPADLATSADGKWLFVLHTGRGTHHPPDEGYDTDGDGLPGDGTANVMFQDVQNEIEVFETQTLVPVRNYTSDTICCRDYRDVDPDHPERGQLLAPVDRWPASRIAYLPPRERWIVAGALPEQLLVLGDRLFVVYSGSNEVQRFAIDAASGSLSALDVAGGLYQTGYNPYGIAATPDGSRVFVADRLGESVTMLDPAAPGTEQHVGLGDSGGAFPATDVEIGEAINFMTAAFTVDGDQTCVHCHREGGNLEKAIAMPLQKDRVYGTRQIMSYRGAFDSRPWFIESAMDELNFFPVINEFARRENYCCEELDPVVWSKYPTLAQCTANPSQAGCNHVTNCEADPPPECAARDYGSPFLRRDTAFLDAARRLLGRERTFGDALHEDAPGGGTRGIALDFNGVTHALGLFLLAEPRLPPNPNRATPTAAQARGRQIFQRAEVGCVMCHPLPVTTTANAPAFSPFGMPVVFAPVVTPRLNLETGADADQVTQGFIDTFQTRGVHVLQDVDGLHIGAAPLRGIWDRGNRFYHDGRAHSLREALATPGHPALAPGEIGRNERHGVLDTHGGTSQLTPEELDDLIEFLKTL